MSFTGITLLGKRGKKKEKKKGKKPSEEGERKREKGKRKKRCRLFLSSFPSFSKGGGERGG